MSKKGYVQHWIGTRKTVLERGEWTALLGLRREFANDELSRDTHGGASETGT